jgi:hypothetical protein
MTATNAGTYQCTGQVVLTNVTASQWVLLRIVRYNSSNVSQETVCGNVISNAGTNVRINVTGKTVMASGDYIKLQVQVQTDTSVDFSTDSWLEIQRVG